MTHEEKVDNILNILRNPKLSADEKAKEISTLFPDWDRSALLKNIEDHIDFPIPIIPGPSMPEKICFNWDGTEWVKVIGE